MYVESWPAQKKRLKAPGSPPDPRKGAINQEGEEYLT
jgi:hypothetical protein